jgi:hypothetical protein
VDARWGCEGKTGVTKNRDYAAASPWYSGRTMYRTLLQRTLISVSFALVASFIGIAVAIHATGGTGGTAATAPNLRQPIANSNGLVAWYPLDGDAKDYSGNSNNGTLTNFTYDGTTNGWVTGKFGKGLLFNGNASTFVSIGSNKPSFQFGMGSFSISAWISPLDTATPPSAAIFGVGSGGGTSSRYGLTYSNSGHQSHLFAFMIDDAGNNISATTTQSVPYGVFSHVVMVVNRLTDLEDVYIDGVKTSISNVSLSSLSSTLNPKGNAVISNFVNGGPPFFPGTIDDVRIYDRALSAAEIQSLYAGSPSANCDQTCKVWLKFDDNSGTTAADSTGLGNAGTLHGTTTWTTGNFASALQLDGSSGYVSLPNLGITAGTVDVWINPASVTGDQRLFSQASGASTQAGQIALNQSSGESGSLWVYDGSAWQRLSANGSVLPNQWNQVVVENNGGTATAFVNGTQQLTATAGFAFSGPTASIGGKFLGTTGGTFNGSVDDFRVYSRFPSPEEVADHWRQGT